MKQLLQNIKTGETMVVEVPAPVVRPGFVLVRNHASLVSAGTERTLVEFAEKNLFEKARSRPDLVQQVVNKTRKEGLFSAMEATFNRLDQPMPLGYSSAGEVVEVGAGVSGFQPGDRVACAGGGYAIHAEYVIVPHNLVVKIPAELEYDRACFATLGAVALHGFRLSEAHLGDRVAVIGLGLLGLLAAGIARAAGCQVFGIDLSAGRVELARSLQFEAAVRAGCEEAARAFTAGQGFDQVLICADAKGNDPIELAAVLARDRAKVVSVGAVRLEIPRKPYYEKELDFVVSRSYGPGRYDPRYEEQGGDYPIGYVRWTEGRNLQALVELMASGRLDVGPLISHRFPIDRAPEAYELITGKSGEPFSGVVLTYASSTLPEGGDAQSRPGAESGKPERVVYSTEYPDGYSTEYTGVYPHFGHVMVRSAADRRPIRVGVLGAGNYANATFLPVLQKTPGAERVGIASAAGAHAQIAAQRFGFRYATSEEKQILTDEEINTVVLLTRHDAHARQALTALAAGKHVYCEKPPALTLEEVAALRTALADPAAPCYMVGYNRRFAPLAVKMRQFLQSTQEPRMITYRVNAGSLPLSHWLHDPQVGGGRIIGEGCHFVDFMTWLSGSLPVEGSIRALPDSAVSHEDNVSLTLRFADGSLGNLIYLSNGDASLPKEYVEVFCGGRVAMCFDFRRLETWQNGTHHTYSARTVSRRGMRQDKGHAAAWAAFLAGIADGKPPIPYDQIFAASELTIRLVEQLRAGTGISREE